MHICDKINKCVENWNIVKDLLKKGKAVVTSHPQIENDHLFVIEPNGQAYLIHIEGKENVKERELTPDECKILLRDLL